MDIGDRVAVQAFSDWANGTRNAPGNTQYNGPSYPGDSQTTILNRWFPYATEAGCEVIWLAETTPETGGTAVTETYLFRFLFYDDRYYWDNTTYFEAQQYLINQILGNYVGYVGIGIEERFGWSEMSPQYTIRKYLSSLHNTSFWM